MDKILTANRTNFKLLNEIINSVHLSSFLKQQNLFSYENKNLNYKLDYLFENMNDTNNLKDQFKLFLCEEAKYTVNRIVVTTPIKITSTSPLFDTNTFEEAFPEYAEYNNIINFDDNMLDRYYREDPLQYIQFLEEKQQQNGQITIISKAFVKKKIQVKTITTDDDTDTITTPFLDFVWIDVFPQKNYYRIHFSEGISSITNNGQLTSEQIYDYFSNKIETLFKISTTMPSAEHVLYKIYKDLTNTAESPYVNRIANFNSKIDSFVSEISEDINYSDENIDGIDLNIRVKKLLERAIIQQDFQTYVETTHNREGFIDKFQYQDSTGGRVLASSNDASFDMSKHDIYFDTKETININKMLNTLWVRWFRNEFIDEANITTQIKVRYEAHPRYYVTHFLFSHVSKEVCEYVLPKFDEYEAKQLD